MRNLTNILLFCILAFILVACAAINLTAPELKECMQFDEDAKDYVGLGLTCQDADDCNPGESIGVESANPKYAVLCNATNMVQFQNPNTNSSIECQSDQDCINTIMGTGAIPVENEEIKKQLFSTMRKMELAQKCKDGHCHITKAFSNKLEAYPWKVGNYRPQR